MKVFSPILMIFLVLSACNKNELYNCESEVYRGKLLIKGICMNYVIQLVDGDLDASLYEKQWTNPFDEQSYTNVFALESICTFPSSIEEGEEFNFVLNEETQNCAVCLAYSPTPNKGISIKVCD